MKRVGFNLDSRLYLPTFASYSPTCVSAGSNLREFSKVKIMRVSQAYTVEIYGNQGCTGPSSSRNVYDNICAYTSGCPSLKFTANRGALQQLTAYSWQACAGLEIFQRCAARVDSLPLNICHNTVESAGGSSELTSYSASWNMDPTVCYSRMARTKSTFNSKHPDLRPRHVHLSSRNPIHDKIADPTANPTTTTQISWRTHSSSRRSTLYPFHHCRLASTSIVGAISTSILASSFQAPIACHPGC